MKTAGIYKIRNKVNGKYYVGSSNNIKRRVLYEHFGMLRDGDHFNKHLQNAWNKYGEDSFEVLVVNPVGEKVTDEFLLEIEQVYLDEMKKKPELGYNNTYVAGKVEHTPEVRRKIGEATKKRLRERGHPLQGTHPTKETLKRMSLSHRGKHLSESAKKKISGNKSVAHRESIKAKKRKWWSELKADPIKYKQFCQKRAARMAEKRYGNKNYVKNYEVIHA